MLVCTFKANTSTFVCMPCFQVFSNVLESQRVKVPIKTSTMYYSNIDPCVEKYGTSFHAKCARDVRQEMDPEEDQNGNMVSGLC